MRLSGPPVPPPGFSCAESGEINLVCSHPDRQLGSPIVEKSRRYFEVNLRFAAQLAEIHEQPFLERNSSRSLFRYRPTQSFKNGSFRFWHHCHLHVTSGAPETKFLGSDCSGTSYLDREGFLIQTEKSHCIPGQNVGFYCCRQRYGRPWRLSRVPQPFCAFPHHFQARAGRAHADWFQRFSPKS